MSLLQKFKDDPVRIESVIDRDGNFARFVGAGVIGDWARTGKQAARFFARKLAEEDPSLFIRACGAAYWIDQKDEEG